MLLPDTESSDRWEEDDRRYFTENFEAAGLVEGEDFTIVNAEGDAATQQSQAEQAIADGASVIVLTSLDTGSGATIIDQATEAGVQVVEYDRFNTGGAGGAAYVSFDNVKVGATMAEVLEPAIDDARARPPPGRRCSTVARRTTTRSCSGRATPRRSRSGSTPATGSSSPTSTSPGGTTPRPRRSWSRSSSTPTTTWTPCSPPTTGWPTRPSPPSRLPASGPIPVSGQDATAAGMQNVLLGRQTMSVYKPIQDEAGVASAVALALRAGEDIASRRLVRVAAESGGTTVSIIGIDAETASRPNRPKVTASCPTSALVPIGVTDENMADTVIADGFRTVEEICTGDVARPTAAGERGLSRVRPIVRRPRTRRGTAAPGCRAPEGGGTVDG